MFRVLEPLHFRRLNGNHFHFQNVYWTPSGQLRLPLHIIDAAAEHRSNNSVSYNYYITPYTNVHGSVIKTRWLHTKVSMKDEYTTGSWRSTSGVSRMTSMGCLSLTDWSFVHDPLISNEETFFHDVLVILKRTLQNY